MSGTSLAVKIGVLILGAGVFLTLFKKVKGLKKYGIVSLFYVLFVSIILAVPTLLLMADSGTELKKIIIAQIFIIAVGSLHVLFAKKILPWYGNEVVSMQIMFIVCTLLFAYLFTNLSFTFFVISKVELVWALSLLWFVVPILLSRAVDKLLEVPLKEFKMWQYPVGGRIEDPSDEEMENPVVISFVFHKNIDTAESTTFRAKAPVGMTLGRLFYFFINDYNSRNPEAMISYIDEENKKPDSWIFYKLKSKFLRSKVALDPEDSIYANEIKENDILICNRFVVTIKTPENEAAK